VTGTAGGKTATASLSVSAGGLHHLALSPASATIAAGSGQAYTATGLDAYGNSLGDLTAATSFSIAPDGSCLATTCTATLAGAHQVSGTSAAATGGATLTVVAGTATGIRLSPHLATIAAGGSQAYAVSEVDRYGNTGADVSASMVLTVSPDGTCAANTCSASVTGLHAVAATLSGQSATATLTVIAGPVATLTLSPASATIDAGGSQAYSTTGTDAFGNSLGDLSPVTALTMAPEGTCSAGRCVALVGGPHVVTATNGGRSATAALAVRSVPPMVAPTPAPSPTSVAPSPSPSPSASPSPGGESVLPTPSPDPGSGPGGPGDAVAVAAVSPLMVGFGLGGILLLTMAVAYGMRFSGRRRRS
jgi:hypothetical protein